MRPRRACRPALSTISFPGFQIGATQRPRSLSPDRGSLRDGRPADVPDDGDSSQLDSTASPPLMDITWLRSRGFPLRGTAFDRDRSVRPDGSGLDLITTRADLVVMSSALDEAHSSWEQVPGDPKVVNALDAVDTPIPLGDDVVLNAIAASEGSDRPDDPKANAMYWLDLDGVVVFHMGDIGTPLTSEQETRLPRSVDVLLALAGATLTIALPTSTRVSIGSSRADRRRCTSATPTPTRRQALEDFLPPARGPNRGSRTASSATITPSLASRVPHRPRPEAAQRLGTRSLVGKPSSRPARRRRPRTGRAAAVSARRRSPELFAAGRFRLRRDRRGTRPQTPVGIQAQLQPSTALPVHADRAVRPQ